MSNKDTNIVAIAGHVPGLLIQAATIATLLVLTYGEFVTSLFAGMASLIWLTVSKGNHADQVGTLRATRASWPYSAHPFPGDNRGVPIIHSPSLALAHLRLARPWRARARQGRVLRAILRAQVRCQAAP